MTWLRCIGCGKIIRFVSHSSGEWGLWDETYLLDWIEKHLSSQCHGDRHYDPEASRNGYSFIEIITEASSLAPSTYGGPLEYERLIVDASKEPQ